MPIVIKTQMRRIPKNCRECPFYINSMDSQGAVQGEGRIYTREADRCVRRKAELVSAAHND